jgi:hypothetical protein
VEVDGDVAVGPGRRAEGANASATFATNVGVSMNRAGAS